MPAPGTRKYPGNGQAAPPTGGAAFWERYKPADKPPPGAGRRQRSIESVSLTKSPQRFAAGRKKGAVRRGSVVADGFDRAAFLGFFAAAFFLR